MSHEKPSLDPAILASLPEETLWDGRPTPESIAQLPGCPAVYLLLASKRVPVQLATTQHLRRLAISRLADAEHAHATRADLAEVVRGIRWRAVHSAFEGRWWYYRLARELYPKRYRQLISFGPVWFLNVDWAQPVPELKVTDQVWRAPGESIGPWLTHDQCTKTLQGLWDLFELCRYPEQVRRAPGGERCAYAEMGRCDAPCDGSVPIGQYVERCRQAWTFAHGETRPWIDDAKARMKSAAREQRFEEAGLLKRQIAWAWRWHDHVRAHARPVSSLNYLLLIPVTRRRAWKPFLFWQGALANGPVLPDRTAAVDALSWLREQFSMDVAEIDPQVRTEQTWLLTHFLHSKAGAASVARRLEDRRVPDTLSQELAEALRERRAAPTATSDERMDLQDDNS
jgi:DNA polymerase-3 subunit epsilon